MDTIKKTTKIMLSDDKKSYEVWFSKNGQTYCLHKSGLKTLDEAVKETTIINGGLRFLKDCLQLK
jgi:hypothetical protein